MPDNVQVLEDEERVGSDQPKRRWMAVAAAFAVGAVAGAVFFGPTVVPVPPDPTGPTLPTVVRPTVTTPDPGLAEVVEGFDDALVAVVRQNAGEPGPEEGAQVRPTWRAEDMALRAADSP